VNKSLKQISSTLLVIFGLLISLAFPASAMALSISDAKNAGLVGEQTNGYLGSVQSSPKAEVKNLVQNTNAKRRSAYANSAKKAGVSLDVMEKRICQRLIQRTPAGQFIRSSSGNWQKK